jgi:hypothetical protein
MRDEGLPAGSVDCCRRGVAGGIAAIYKVHKTSDSITDC